MKKSEFIKKLKSEISHDGTGDKTCPNCGHILEHGDRWFDHTSSLAFNMLYFLGLPELMRDALKEKVESAIRDMSPTENNTKDAQMLADWCVENLGIKWDDEN